MTIAAMAFALVNQDAEISGAQLVSKMIRRYYDAKTIGGTIKTDLDVSGATLGITTTLWIERPNKLYLRQVTTAGPSFLVTADGKEYSYERPSVGGQVSTSPGRLVEYQGSTDIGGVYTSAALSIAERSNPLDLAIARQDDLKMLRDQWVTLKDGGEKEVDGKPCRMVTGQWTSNPVYGVLGHYAMWITSEGDLIKMEIQGPNPELAGSKIVRTHTVDLKVGATPPEGQFTVAK